MKKIVNANIYVEGKGIVKTSLLFDDKIIQIGGDICCDCEEIVVDDGCVVLPAFIDRHIHGAGGYDSMDANKQALQKMADTLLKEGTARFLFTTMTQSEKTILSALSAIKEFKQNQTGGAKVLGVHLEGPFICEKYKGAQPSEFILPPSVEQFDKFNAASGNNILVCTIAPELENSEKLINHLKQKNICVSIGHSSAGYEDIVKFANSGLVSVTHTFNAQSPIHHRQIGVAGSSLLIDNIYSELIADGIHVSYPAINLLIKNKPKDKLTLITDAMRAKGLGDCISELGGQKVIVSNGSARLSDGVLAGSVLTMNTAIKNLVTNLNIPLTQAVNYATINVAKSLSLDALYGSIALNKSADLVILNKEFEVVATLLEGEIVYEK